MWNQKLHQTLIELNFEYSKMDPSLYIKREQNGSVLFLAVYVNDLLLFSDNRNAKEAIIKELQRRYKMRNLEAVRRVLSINVQRDRQLKIITLDQKLYRRNLVAVQYEGLLSSEDPVGH